MSTSTPAMTTVPGVSAVSTGAGAVACANTSTSAGTTSRPENIDTQAEAGPSTITNHTGKSEEEDTDAVALTGAGPGSSPSSSPVDAQGGKKEDGSGAGAGTSTPPVPKCHLRALIISGQTHVFSFEPELTVGRVKEIIWSSWPSEWTEPAAPPSPAFLRILYSGRILQDDSTLGSNSIPTSLQPTNPTVMHISVRSFSLKGDEDPKKDGLHATLSRRSSRRRPNQAQEDVGGCKCVVM